MYFHFPRLSGKQQQLVMGGHKDHHHGGGGGGHREHRHPGRETPMSGQDGGANIYIILDRNDWN